MKPVHWLLLALAVGGAAAVWYSRTHAAAAPVPSQAKPDPKAVALGAALDLANKYL
jgi:hypothetical protein